MEDSSTFQFILDRGRAEGRAEGQAEGRAAGQAEGRAEGLARAIVAIAERLLGRAPEGLPGRLLHLNPEELDLLLRRALDAKGPAELRALLRARRGRRTRP